MNSDEQRRFYHWLLDNDNQFVELKLSAVQSDRSKAQNAYYWGVVLKILAMEFDGSDSQYAKDCMHHWMKRMFLLNEDQYYNQRIPTPSSTELSTKEFSKYLQSIRDWVYHEHQINIPEPNEPGVL